MNSERISPFWVNGYQPFSAIIKDKVLVAAMVDRLTHKAYLINMTGQSYRLKETQKLKEKKLIS